MSAVSFAVKTIRNIDGAPSELTQIADTVIALETSLDHVRRCCTTDHKLAEGLAFSSPTQRANTHGTYDLSPAQTASPTRESYDPLLPFIRHQSKLKAFRQQVSDIRSDLVLALAAVNYGQTGRIEMDLQQLVHFGAATLQTLDQQASQIGDLTQKTENMTLSLKTRWHDYWKQPELQASEAHSVVGCSAPSQQQDGEGGAKFGSQKSLDPKYGSSKGPNTQRSKSFHFSHLNAGRAVICEAEKTDHACKARRERVSRIHPLQRVR